MFLISEPMVLCLVCADGIFGYGRPWIAESKHDADMRIEEGKESDRSLGSKPTTTLYSTTRYQFYTQKLTKLTWDRGYTHF